jgi:hypothetical protein
MPHSSSPCGCDGFPSQISPRVSEVFLFNSENVIGIYGRILFLEFGIKTSKGRERIDATSYSRYWGVRNYLKKLENTYPEASNQC